MVDAKVIGQRLTKLRGEKSREEVAFQNKISASALSMYENGKRIPRDEIKVRLAKYFGVTVESIFFAI